MSFMDKLAEERRARLAAERLLDLKQAELATTTQRLDQQRRALAQEITQTRAECASAQSENQRIRSDLAAARRQIDAAERRLWHSVETIQDGFAVFDDKGCLVAANKAFFAAFHEIDDVKPGISYDRLLQLTLDEGLVDPGPNTPAAWHARMLTRWTSARPEPIVVKLFNNRSVRISDRRTPTGEMVTLAVDITATVRAEARLRAARQRANAANKAKSAFLANMSHEIRTPMNGVVSMADMLLQGPLDEDQRQCAETIRNSGEALLTIIDDVLDYSKIESDRVVLRAQAFDLEYMIQEIAMLLQPGAREKGLSLMVDYDLFLPTRFVGDPGRLRQVLTNLIGNAVKFTEKGHVVIRAVGMPEAEGRVAVRIAVEDTGIGIAKDKIEHIFGEFNQVQDGRNRAFEGAGLGLSISRKLARLMGGDIWVTSVPNVGSCFGLALSMATAEPFSIDLPSVPKSLRSVLLADPRAVARTVLSRQLRSCGLAVMDIAHGADAVAQSGCDAAIISSEVDDSAGAQTIAALRKTGFSGPCVRLVANAGVARIDGCTDVVMPASRRSVLAALSRLPGSGSALNGAGAGPLDVLLAEDNKTNQLVFSKIVEGLPMRLRIAANGREAVEEVSRKCPDLVFMDISMPFMDGKEATRVIREQLDPGNTLPIIAVTAHAMQGDREAALSAGLTDYLTKPVRKAEILRVIGQHFPQLGPSLALCG